MNLLHLKYAVEIARVGSINKASDNLMMGQPNLSRAIKDLETSLGITIFERTAKGMVPTAEGEEFLHHAESILKQVEEVKAIYTSGGAHKQKFSASVPRASYINDAFVQLTRKLDNSSAEVRYKETSSSRTFSSVMQSEYKLGIIRYAEAYDAYFAELLEEKNLCCEPVGEFVQVLIINRQSPLANKPSVGPQDLAPLMQITHPDAFAPSLPFLDRSDEEDNPLEVMQRIFVFDRASQFELLSANPNAFLLGFSSPMHMLDRYGLIQRPCPECGRKYKDVLIYRKDYTLTDLDRAFIDQLHISRKRYT